jgi:hypothetical protein
VGCRVDWDSLETPFHFCRSWVRRQLGVWFSSTEGECTGVSQAPVLAMALEVIYLMLLSLGPPTWEGDLEVV